MSAVYRGSDFLKAWDDAIQAARETGEEQYVFKYEGNRLRMAGRTMHPSFMGGPVPKWDPVRDQFSRMLSQAV